MCRYSCLLELRNVEMKTRESLCHDCHVLGAGPADNVGWLGTEQRQCKHWSGIHPYMYNVQLQAVSWCHLATRRRRDFPSTKISPHSLTTIKTFIFSATFCLFFHHFRVFTHPKRHWADGPLSAYLSVPRVNISQDSGDLLPQFYLSTLFFDPVFIVKPGRETKRGPGL